MGKTAIPLSPWPDLPKLTPSQPKKRRECFSFGVQHLWLCRVLPLGWCLWTTGPFLCLSRQGPPKSLPSCFRDEGETPKCNCWHCCLGCCKHMPLFPIKRQFSKWSRSFGLLARATLCQGRKKRFSLYRTSHPPDCPLFMPTKPWITGIAWLRTAVSSLRKHVALSELWRTQTT